MSLSSRGLRDLRVRADVARIKTSCMRMQPLTPEPQGAGLGALPLLRGSFRNVTAGELAFKAPGWLADIQDTMIISDEQVRRALHYLRTTAADSANDVSHDVSDDLVVRVRAALQDMPDVRDDRVEEAMGRLRGDGPSATEVAAKIIGRTISDSLR